MVECYPFINSLFNSVSYILSFKGKGKTWIIDPGDVNEIIKWLEIREQFIFGILLTHAHFDHIYGINTLLETYSEAKIYTNEFGRNMLLDEKLNMSKYHETPFRINDPHSVCIIENGIEMDLNNDVLAKAIFTPGHNPSCISWIVEDMLFTGDSYIPGIKTVTNLPRSNRVQAKESEDLIKQLAVGRTIYPGHKI